MTQIEKIKPLLVRGSYKKIADTVGVDKGTISQFFSLKSRETLRISDETRDRILKATADRLEETGNACFKTAKELRTKESA